MVNFEEVFDRIKFATNTRTQVEIAEVLDIRQSSISDAKRRNSVPADWFMKLFEDRGLNPDWLKKGTGPMYLRTENGYTPVEAPMGVLVCEDAAKYGGPDAKSTVVFVHSTQMQGKDKDAEEALPPLGRLSVPQSFALPGICIVRIDVSSMEPHILKGAYVGIDTDRKNVASGELFAVNLPYEGVVIKRVYIDTQNGKLLLHSENPAHPVLFLPLDAHEAHIVGRVAWILQRY